MFFPECFPPWRGSALIDIRIRELIEKAAGGGIREIVLATGTSVEGETTAAYIANRLEASETTVTRIASGIPMGGDLKYVDQVTLKKAMESRRVVEIP